MKGEIDIDALRDALGHLRHVTAYIAGLLPGVEDLNQSHLPQHERTAYVLRDNNFADGFATREAKGKSPLREDRIDMHARLGVIFCHLSYGVKNLL